MAAEVSVQCPADPQAAGASILCTAIVTVGRLGSPTPILPTGQVTNTTVVATSPVSTGVMDCVKRQMSLWTFAPPKGGSFSVERSFAFRR